MTLSEAIEHLIHVLNKNDFSCESCKQEHRQLLDWLIELQISRRQLKQIRNIVSEEKENESEN